MKINSVSCTQFAGIRDRSISFGDGVNIVFGKNESGKSTLVSLLSRTLFQSARIDRRSDRGFIDMYFPSARRVGGSGDFIDGRISFETEKGVYTLTKEWGADGRCTLSTPEGAIRDSKRIEQALREILRYGEGVYTDMLLSPQSNAGPALQRLMDTKAGGAKQEIADAVTAAFAESGGISVDAIEQAIGAQIAHIAGGHWDLERQQPERRNGRWVRDQGEILEAYYTLEDKRKVLQRITELEDAADSAAKTYKEREAALREAQDAYSAFDKYASLLAVQSVKKREIERLRDDLRKYADVLDKWPAYGEELQTARKLQAEQADRAILDAYEKAERLAERVKTLTDQVSGMSCPEQTEITAAEAAQQQLAALENKLCGMDLSVAIRMLGGHTVQVRSLRTGEALDVSGKSVSITEAVRITVPDVMEMNLVPADVDVSAAEAAIAGKRAVISGIFEKYGAATTVELREKKQAFDDAQRELDTARKEFQLALGGVSYEDLSGQRAAVRVPVRDREAIDSDIRALCKNGDVVSFAATRQAVIAEYEREYTSLDALQARAAETGKRLEDAEKTTDAGADIPPEYRDISDPEKYKKTLQADVDARQAPRDTALQMKTAAENRLAQYQEGLEEDPAEGAERAERAFEEKKVLLAHWLHIRKVFMQQKQLLTGDPMRDITGSFVRYLGIISSGRVTTEFPERDKLNMDIYSGDRLLDHGKLSSGTKETVLLAFRLAVLDHLFPAGGGIIVLDDPFTDMDDDRANQACALVRECGKHHQVIFLTCREDYLEKLSGSVIRIE